MRPTVYADYSLRVLTYVGLKEPNLSTVKEISESYAISRNYLMKVELGATVKHRSRVAAGLMCARSTWSNLGYFRYRRGIGQKPWASTPSDGLNLLR